MPPLTIAYRLGSSDSTIPVMTADVFGVNSLGLMTAAFPPAIAPINGCRTNCAGKLEGLSQANIMSAHIFSPGKSTTTRREYISILSRRV